MKRIIKAILKGAFGVRLQRVSKVSKKKEPVFFTTQNLLYEKDTFFNTVYDEGIQLTGTPVDDSKRYFTKRRARFYNTIQFFLQTQELKGSIAECGCFRGLSSYIMCTYLQKADPKFNGRDFFIIDSFEGLSEPSSADSLGVDENGSPKYFVGSGHFATPVDVVKNSLSKFPEIFFHQGWIPSVLNSLPENRYKFVHIDLDFYEPIRGALDYFYPRLVEDGIIVIDDYGSLYWPGAKKAVEEFCIEHRINFLKITTAQAIIRKK